MKIGAGADLQPDAKVDRAAPTLALKAAQTGTSKRPNLLQPCWGYAHEPKPNRMLIFSLNRSVAEATFLGATPPPDPGRSAQRRSPELTFCPPPAAPLRVSSEPTWRLRKRRRAPRLEWWAACLRSFLPSRPKPREKPLPSPSVRGDAPPPVPQRRRREGTRCA